jgi:hypothetical protein
VRLKALVALVVVGSAVLGADAASGNQRAGADPFATADVSVTPLRYSPAWLPPGIVEGERSRSADALNLRRVWARPGAKPNGPVKGWVILQVYDTGYAGPMDCRDGANVVINGVSGGLWPNGTVSAGCVRWRPDPRTVLVLTEYELAMGRDDLLGIARSVRPDPGWMTVPLRLDRPGTLVTTTQLWAGLRGRSATEWSVALGLGHSILRTGIWNVTVTLSRSGTDPIPGKAQALTVGGRPARYAVVMVPTTAPYFGPGEARLVVDFGSRIRLTVSVVFHGGDTPSMADLASVAADTRIGRPDLSWIGSRPD